MRAVSSRCCNASSGRARQKIATLDRIDPGTGLTAVPVLPRNAAARSCDGAPRSALRHAARVRDRRVRRLSANVRRQGCGFLPAHDRRADHARVASRGRSVRALRRLDIGRGGASASMPTRFGHWPSASRRACASSGCTIRARSRAGMSTTRVIVIGCPPGAHDDPEPVIARALASRARQRRAGPGRFSRSPIRPPAGGPSASCAGSGVTRTSTPNAG